MADRKNSGGMDKNTAAIGCKSREEQKIEGASVGKKKQKEMQPDLVEKRSRKARERVRDLEREDCENTGERKEREKKKATGRIRGPYTLPRII